MTKASKVYGKLPNRSAAKKAPAKKVTRVAAKKATPAKKVPAKLAKRVAATFTKNSEALGKKTLKNFKTEVLTPPAPLSFPHVVAKKRDLMGDGDAPATDPDTKTTRRNLLGDDDAPARATGKSPALSAPYKAEDVYARVAEIAGENSFDGAILHEFFNEIGNVRSMVHGYVEEMAKKEDSLIDSCQRAKLDGVAVREVTRLSTYPVPTQRAIAAYLSFMLATT